VSQLSLVVANAEKHSDNPEFRKDMLVTIEDSVSKMKRLLARLHQGADGQPAAVTIELAGFLRAALQKWVTGGTPVQLSCEFDSAVVAADREKLGAVVAHLIQNAVEAAPDVDGEVLVRLSRSGRDALIDVTDNGPGMTREFVAKELFRPFKSTKEGGYGIGAFESRELVREMGGQLEVVSTPGRGTTMRVKLPLAQPVAVVAGSRRAGGVGLDGD
jgi:putative PEP-CTERM system histidine kinase